MFRSLPCPRMVHRGQHLPSPAFCSLPNYTISWGTLRLLLWVFRAIPPPPSRPFSVQLPYLAPFHSQQGRRSLPPPTWGGTNYLQSATARPLTFSSSLASISLLPPTDHLGFTWLSTIFPSDRHFPSNPSSLPPALITLRFKDSGFPASRLDTSPAPSLVSRSRFLPAQSFPPLAEKRLRPSLG